MPTPIVTELENGLRVLLLENRAAPVATFWIWYGVGSRHEVPGGTMEAITKRNPNSARVSQRSPNARLRCRIDPTL